MLKEYELKLRNSMDRFNSEKNYIHEKRNAMGHCPYCNSNIKDRKIALYKGIIRSLYAVYCWCGKNKRHEFEMRDIRHLLGKNEYTRFGDLVRFGGIVYKPKINGESKKALYGINMARAKEFFAGQREIPIQIILDQITGETIGVVAMGGVNDFPELSAFLTKEGLYDHEMPVQGSLINS